MAFPSPPVDQICPYCGHHDAIGRPEFEWPYAVLGVASPILILIGMFLSNGFRILCFLAACGCGVLTLHYAFLYFTHVQCNHCMTTWNPRSEG